MKKLLIFCIISILILFQSVALAANLYVSPNGSGGACSESAPCALSYAISNANYGDNIYLRSGYYGDLNISGERNSNYITLAAQAGHNPGFRSVRITASSRWIIRGFEISPELNPSAGVPDYLINIYHDCDDIIVEDNYIFNTRDSSNWTADDWNTRAGYMAIFAQGRNSIIRNNRLKNIYFGIIITGEGSLIEHNTIENIAMDGMAGAENNITIQYNTLKNFYKVNANHDDAIQFYRANNDPTPLENITVRGNFIMSYEPGATYALRAQPQGICGFATEGERGYFRNFLIENNVVLVQHWHGISLYGALNARIINNIACDPAEAYPTWISFNDLGTNCTVRNNMTSNYVIGGDNITADHNIDIENYGLDALFADHQNYDFRHRPTSPAIDAGSGVLAPSVDIERHARPQGSGYDIGAYEYGGGQPQPPDILYGDVSGDGSITALDASMAARYAAALISLTQDQLDRADVNYDNTVTAVDAAFIARFAAGLITGF